jgi:hypothetical protein
MTVSAETHAKLRHAQNLLRHTVPNGDPAVIFDRALTLLVEQLERTKFAAQKGPGRKQGGRRIAKPRANARTTPDTQSSAEPGTKARPAVPSRRIPAAVKREVWKRDGGQCGFMGTAGRCPERGFLEYHHEVPFAAGGEATVSNISLRCKRHNAHEAARFFGAGISARSGGSVVGPDRVEAMPDRHG